MRRLCRFIVPRPARRALGRGGGGPAPLRRGLRWQSRGLLAGPRNPPRSLRRCAAPVGGGRGSVCPSPPFGGVGAFSGMRAAPWSRGALRPAPPPSASPAALFRAGPPCAAGRAARPLRSPRAPPRRLPPRSGCSSLRPPGCFASLRGRPPAPLLRPSARPHRGFGVATLRAARFGGRARSAPPPSASPVAPAGGRRGPPSARAPPSAGYGRSAPPPGARPAFGGPFYAPRPRRLFSLRSFFCASRLLPASRALPLARRAFRRLSSAPLPRRGGYVYKRKEMRPHQPV